MNLMKHFLKSHLNHLFIVLIRTLVIIFTHQRQFPSNGVWPRKHVVCDCIMSLCVLLRAKFNEERSTIKHQFIFSRVSDEPWVKRSLPETYVLMRIKPLSAGMSGGVHEWFPMIRLPDKRCPLNCQCSDVSAWGRWALMVQGSLLIAQWG